MQATAAGPFGTTAGVQLLELDQSVLALPSQVLVQPPGNADTDDGDATTTSSAATSATSTPSTPDAFDRLVRLIPAPSPRVPEE